MNGDRVVLIGGTLIERDQEYGYLETLLTRRFPTARSPSATSAGAATPSRGAPRPVRPGPRGVRPPDDHVEALKPTVIFLSYGPNESFGGKAGLPKFLQDLEKLLKAIESTKARLVFLSPTRQEDLGPPLPDPTTPQCQPGPLPGRHQGGGRKRGALFVNLFDLLPGRDEGRPGCR